MAQQSYVAETQVLRRVASNPECTWSYSKHAEERMAERNIQASDIQQALINGHVVLEERKRDLLWRIDGKDIDGRRIQVVAAIYKEAIEIKIVTVF
jgi:hypothetical protein